MDLKFNHLHPKDIAELMEVENSSFPDPWTPGLFEQELQNKLAHYLIVRLEDRLIAYGGMWLIADEAHITNIAVHASFRRQGIGNQLLTRMVDYARIMNMRQMTLEVRASNEEAQRLYDKTGFFAVGRRPRYYLNNGEDAIIMWKSL